jgi:acyl carrier protein
LKATKSSCHGKNPQLRPELSCLQNGERSLSSSAEIDIAERVKIIVAEHLSIARDRVTETAKLADDLGADSLDAIELTFAFEEAFGIYIPDEATEGIVTVGDAIIYLQKHDK